MPRILVTGFEPFDRWAVNSSWEAARLVAGRWRDSAVARLPVDHHRAAEAVRALVAQHAPKIWLLAGLAADAAPRLERIGRAGPLSLHGGPVLRRGRWPWGAARAGAAARGLPLRLSGDAGGYVCDTTYWAALGTAVPLVAFLHLPPVHGAWTPGRLAAVADAVLGAALNAPAGG